MAGGDIINRKPPVLPEDSSAEELPEQLIGNLDDDDNDPLQQMGDEPENSADQLQNLDNIESPARQTPSPDDTKRQELHQKEVERSKQLADKIKSGKQSAQKTVTKGGDQAATAALKDKGAQAAERSAQAAAKAAGEATKKAAKQAARAIGQTIKKLVTQLLAKNPYVWIGIAIIVVVILIILLVVALFAFSGKTGKGPASYPSTVSQQEQATLLSALSGSQISNNKIVAETIADEKERYQIIKKNAQKYSPNLVGTIDGKITEFNPLLDSILTTANKVERKRILNDLMKKMLEFEGTLPFGSWISQIALEFVNEGSITFCKIAKNATGVNVTANVACASFVSTVLWKAGVPNPIQTSVDAVWGQRSTRVIVDRPAVKSADYYTQHKAKLRPGDLIFWGDGACSKGGSKKFDHIGIYVGNDEAADNSSSNKKIMKRGAAKRDSCRVFNAAKRYGADS